MKPKRGTREDDERILLALHLVECEGWTCRAAGEVIGLTKNAVIGHTGRVRSHYGICRCNVHENRTGGMPALWWATSEHARGLVDSLVSGRD
jgi:hypothetical protein